MRYLVIRYSPYIDYRQLDDKLRDIDEHCRSLELAEQLALEWTARVGEHRR